MFIDNDFDYDKLALKQLDVLSARDPIHYKKVLQIIDDISEYGYGGHFHPEMLRGNRSGWCSKEVDKKNRVVFIINNGRVQVAQVMGHYDDK
jgi:toxin YoeB